MITRVARNDVVRYIRTGEVGLVKGWADHERLAQNGTILDVAISAEKTIQGNGNAFEFVAHGKPVMSVIRTTWTLIALTLTGLLAAWIGFWLWHDHGVSLLGSVTLGIASWLMHWQAVYLLTLRPRRTRIALPARVKVAKGVRAQGQPPTGTYKV